VGIAAVNQVMQISIVQASLTGLGDGCLLAVVDQIVLHNTVVIHPAARSVAISYCDGPKIVDQSVSDHRHMRSGVPALDSVTGIDDNVIRDDGIWNLRIDTSRGMPVRAVAIRRDIYYEVSDHIVVRNASIVVPSAGLNCAAAIVSTRCLHIVHIVSNGL